MLFTPLLVRLRLRYGVRFVVFGLAGEYAYFLRRAEATQRLQGAFACAVS